MKDWAIVVSGAVLVALASVAVAEIKFVGALWSKFSLTFKMVDNFKSVLFLSIIPANDCKSTG